ncbi:MAG: HD domain-containing protein [Planctomycetes bacterium]|jgi:HD-GYP domain-containing protein (c-di-GMP phosphodiesterase class II)|nr:HD domain-containing protein [Planctomycetota bacterium]
MKTEELALRIEGLTERLGCMEKRLATVEKTAGGAQAPAPAPKQPQPKQARQPWKMDAARVETMVAEMYSSVRNDPQEALSFETGARDCYLPAHARNVSKLAMFLADRHGFSEASTRTMGICGLLHDAGMDCLPHELTTEGRPLTQEEYQQVRTHPTLGAEYIKHNYRFGSLLSSVIPVVVEQHHERADGTGYPNGLPGDRIHNFARVLAIADSYEAMTTPRPFRSPRHPADAMRTLLVQGCHSHQAGMYDRSMLKTFLWSSSLYPVGCTVGLSDGNLACVVSVTADPKQPVIKLLTGDRSGQVVNLTQHNELTITGGRNGDFEARRPAKKT